MNNHPFAHTVRDAASKLIPPRAFLRRDRESALFITNAPRIDPDADWLRIFADADFIAHIENGLVRLLPGESWLKKLEDAFPEAPDHLSSSLIRFRNASPCPEAIGLFARGVRILDGECDTDYETRLRKLAAVCLRSGTGGGLYACSLINFEIKRRDDL